MTTCCSRISKLYMVISNLLFACLGVAAIAAGLMGIQNKFIGATLFPDNTFKYLAILGAIIIVASLLGILGAFVRRNALTYLYMIIIFGALAFQILIGVQIYKKAANPSGYLSELWPASTPNYRANLQNQFTCCGLQTATDNVVLTSTCSATASINSLPPCAPILQAYIKYAFGKSYLAIFAALSLELLALTNAITLICSGSNREDDDERRARRKSGIRLDDMSVAGTPTTLVGEEQKYYYGASNPATPTANGPQSPGFERDTRYDSYDIYRHNNASNHYSDNYNDSTIHNNRNGNSNAYSGGGYY